MVHGPEWAGTSYIASLVFRRLPHNISETPATWNFSCPTFNHTYITHTEARLCPTSWHKYPFSVPPHIHKMIKSPASGIFSRKHVLMPSPWKIKGLYSVFLWKAPYLYLLHMVKWVPHASVPIWERNCYLSIFPNLFMAQTSWKWPEKYYSYFSLSFNSTFWCLGLSANPQTNLGVKYCKIYTGRMVSIWNGLYVAEERLNSQACPSLMPHPRHHYSRGIQPCCSHPQHLHILEL